MKMYLQPHDGSGRVILCESHAEVFAAIEKLRAEGVTEITRTGGDVICDFCSTPEVHWLYVLANPGAVIQAGDVTHADADGQWGACNVCNSHILAGEWDALAARSLETFYAHHPEAATMPRTIMQFSIRGAHGYFRAGWDGTKPATVVPDKDFLRDAGISEE